jgi:ribosome biogenesis GTPase A
MMQISWYPGHMAKAKRQLSEQLSRVDVIVEMCDARLPYSSRNPVLNDMVAGKERILVLNKADLADPARTDGWLRRFRVAGLCAYAWNASGGHTSQVWQWIDRAGYPIIEKAKQKGVRKILRVMVAGVPNVGKSTFINALYGVRAMKVADRPGVTRTSQWTRVKPYLELLDTPGLLWPRLDDPQAARRLCYIGSIRDEAVNTERLAISLLEELLTICPDRVTDRYKLSDASLRGDLLMEAVCIGRGFLLKGGMTDTRRGGAIVLDEFRSGKLGRITFERESGDIPPITDAAVAHTAREE